MQKVLGCLFFSAASSSLPSLAAV